jgi:hypothetical protein
MSFKQDIKRDRRKGRKEIGISHLCGTAHHCKSTTLRKRILTVSSQAPKLEEPLLRDFTFVLMMMDDGQIGTIKLFVTNFVASNIAHCFIHSITKVGHLDHNVLTNMSHAILCSLHNSSVHVGTITCDGASHHVHPLDF